VVNGADSGEQFVAPHERHAVIGSAAKFETQVVAAGRHRFEKRSDPETVMVGQAARRRRIAGRSGSVKGTAANRDDAVA
jgi:hypothetical protein